MTLREFWENVNRRGPMLSPYLGPCWLWTGTLTSKGYASMRDGGRRWRGHRWLWERMNGAMPAGLEPDHLCRNRACVNPAHLEPVTCRENLLRGDTIAARNARKTHCVHGHRFTPENTIIRRNDGCRECRACAHRPRRRGVALRAAG